MYVFFFPLLSSLQSKAAKPSEGWSDPPQYLPLYLPQNPLVQTPSGSP